MNYLIIFLVPLLVGYFMGALPFGYWAGKLKGIDLTKEGSGSTGTTNVLRLVGKKEAFFVLLGDFLKGVLAPIVSKLVVASLLVTSAENPSWMLPLVGVLASFAALLGHVKSCWIGFKGGKAVATGVGTMFGLDWRVGLVTAIIWGSTVVLSKYSSLGALVAVPLSPLTMYFFQSDYFKLLPNSPLITQTLIYTAYCLVGAIYIVYKHRANIKRLIEGTEPKVGKK
ncbi:MAG: glycerol-3-phosphate 1-O-acyltransferase PlsY [Candidatus Caenarcaniphilales bacterium]|nr:glycerol-3-phosphate 1-O-acyltransferase PlsY [Candidatus Caenarcaniphilales bacterium]